jgi:hypothetical protein
MGDVPGSNPGILSLQEAVTTRQHAFYHGLAGVKEKLGQPEEPL